MIGQSPASFLCPFSFSNYRFESSTTERLYTRASAEDEEKRRSVYVYSGSTFIYLHHHHVLRLSSIHRVCLCWTCAKENRERRREITFNIISIYLGGLHPSSSLTSPSFTHASSFFSCPFKFCNIQNPQRKILSLPPTKNIMYNFNNNISICR